MANWSVVVGMGRGRGSNGSRHQKSLARVSTAEETELLNHPSPGGSGGNGVWAKGKMSLMSDKDGMALHDCKAAGCQVVTLNISGAHFDTRVGVLNQHPDTLLGNPDKRKKYYDSIRGEYFFDRHRPTFEAIFHYYQYGKLRKPPNVSDDIFLDELDYFEIEKDVVDDFKRNEGYTEDEYVYPENPTCKTIWMLFEYPETSTMAFVIGCISISITLISIALIVSESMPDFQELSLCAKNKSANNSADTDANNDAPQWSSIFFIIDTICTLWFTAEVVIRCVVCPSKFAFFKDIKNYIDIAAVVPYFVTVGSVVITMSCKVASENTSLAFLRVLRLIRILKLTKHFSGLQCLVLTFQASVRGLFLFVITLMICVLLFSSAIFYVESGENKNRPDGEGSEKITSIPNGFWWAVITMCTVGYGDVYPMTTMGKIVGCLCAVSGVLTLAIPVPIITENFNKFYIHRSSRKSDS